MQIAGSVLDWLMDGDPSIRWQVLRDLKAASPEVVERERARVAEEGWGAQFLSVQDPDGKWGGGLYTHKWTSTTYTLLLLRRLGLPPDHPQARHGCQVLLDSGFYRDGGINFFASLDHSETCVTGMVLSILAYFDYPDERLVSIAEHLLGQQMPDGGWNCQSYNGAHHSSLHTTLSVLEGLWLFEQMHPEHAGRVQAARQGGHEFLLAHRLYKSHRTGQVIDEKMTRFSFPPRWFYDVLRALDYWQDAYAPADPRLEDAIALVHRRQKPDGRWVLQNRHTGRVYFDMEKVGQPSRWNTLRALRVLRWWENAH